MDIETLATSYRTEMEQRYGTIPDSIATTINNRQFTPVFPDDAYRLTGKVLDGTLNVAYREPIYVGETFKSANQVARTIRWNRV